MGSDHCGCGSDPISVPPRIAESHVPTSAVARQVSPLLDTLDAVSVDTNEAAPIARPTDLRPHGREIPVKLRHREIADADMNDAWTVRTQEHAVGEVGILGDGDTEAPDHGLAVADVGVDGDAVEVAGYRRSIVRDNIFVMPMRAKSAASRILLIPSCRMTPPNTREHYTNI